MKLKPPRWNVSPALIAPEARNLWKGLAFVAPLWDVAGGKGALLNSFGQPLSGSNLVAGSTAEKRATPYGLGVGISGASNLLHQSSYAPIVTADGAGTGDFTMVCLANPKAEARASIALGQRVSGGSNDWVYLFFNGAETGGNVSGRFSFSTYSSAVTHASILNVIDGQTRLWGGVRSGTQLTAYIDGVSRATATGTVRAIIGPTSSFGIGQNAEYTNFRIATDCDIIYVAGWNRALSTAEMRLLARDPFCMFRPVPEWRGVWTAIVGGSTIAKAVAWRVMGRAAKSSAWRIFGRSLKASAWRLFARTSKASTWRVFARSAKAAAWQLFTRASKSSAWRLFTRASKSTSWRVFTRATKATAWSILNTLQAAKAVSWRIMGRASKPASWRILTRVAKSSAWRVFTRASKYSTWRIFTRSVKATSWRVFARNARTTAWLIFTRAGKTTAWRIFTRAVKPTSWRIAGRRAVVASWRILTRAARAVAWRIGALPTAEPDVHLNAELHVRSLNAGLHVRTIFAKLSKL